MAAFELTEYMPQAYVGGIAHGPCTGLSYQPWGSQRNFSRCCFCEEPNPPSRLCEEPNPPPRLCEEQSDEAIQFLRLRLDRVTALAKTVARSRDKAVRRTLHHEGPTPPRRLCEEHNPPPRLCEEQSDEAIQFLRLRLDRVTAFGMTSVCRSVFARNETA